MFSKACLNYLSEQYPTLTRSPVGDKWYKRITTNSGVRGTRNVNKLKLQA